MKSSRNKKDRGASLVEYCLLVGMIALVAIMAVRAFGGRLSNQYSRVNEEAGW